MTKLEFSKPEMDIIKSKIYLTDLQKEILDCKLEGNLTLDGIALKLNVSKSTVSYQWKQIIKKIFKVI
jgi:DNA-binding CsgD family transcriptional regulator